MVFIKRKKTFSRGKKTSTMHVIRQEKKINKQNTFYCASL